MKELENILEKLEQINDQMHREAIMYNAELKDRTSKGLEGDEAIKHYNEWMIKAGMSYLTVK